MSVFENHDSGSLIGSMIDDRFTLESEVARSTSSNTYVAVDERSGQDVVLRLFSVAATRNDGDSILRNAAAVSGLQHPHIVRPMAYGFADVDGEDRAYVVHERLPGGSLQDIIDRNRRLTPSQALVLGVEVCRALDFAHKRGFVHHDLRPSAIVFGEDRKARVADIGIASVVAERSWRNTSSISMERARYAAPEQATGEAFDEKADIYALALILVESVTGQVPFLADSVVGTLSARVDKLFPVSADLSGLAAVLEKAGRSYPEERSSAADMGRGLVQAAPTLARPTPLPIVMIAATSAEAARRDPSGSIRFGDDSSATMFRPAIAGDRSGGSERPLISTSPTDVERRTNPGRPLIDDTPSGAHRMVIRGAGSDRTNGFDSGNGNGGYGNGGYGYDDDYLDPVDPGDDGPSIGRWIVAAVAVLALITGGYFVFNAVQSKSYAVPMLAGVDEGTALNMITEYDWKVETVEETNTDIATGVIIRTDPPEGSSLRSGANIIFYVSSGPPPVPLPDVVGIKADRAKEILTQAGLVIGDESLEYDDNIPEGSVIRWVVKEQPNLTAGQTVTSGTIIDLVVSQGATPIEVPNLVCMSVTQAENKLRDVGLKLNRADTAFSDVPSGAIAEQAPAAGEQLSPGRAVTVKISRGPELVEFPTVVGLTLAEAKTKLEQAGFVVGTLEGDQAKKVTAATRIATVSAACAAAAAESADSTTAAPTTTAAPAPITVKAGTQVAKGTTINLKFG